MLKFIARKLVALIPKVLIISIILFFAMDLLPGDPLTRAMNPDTYGTLTEFQKDQYREAMGLNDPAIVRYFRWLGGIVLHGDLGLSSVTGADIGKTLAGRWPYTIELAFWGVVLGTFIGVLLGFLAAIKKNTIIDYTATGLSIVGICLPNFFFAIVFLMFFCLKLKWFPVGGRMPVGDDSLIARLPYMILPIFTVSFGLWGAMTRFVRNTMLDVMNKDYVKTARSKGLKESTVTFKHIFRNALPPVMTMIVMRIPMIIGGNVVVENVFNYPAMGAYGLEAINAGDIPVMMITTMASAILVLISSTLVDIVAGMLDPRIRIQ